MTFNSGVIFQRRSQAVIIAFILAVFAHLIGGVPTQAQTAIDASIELPPGFTVAEISGLNSPTDMVFLPSGELLILEKGVGDGPDGSAQVRVVLNDELRTEPVLTLSTNTFGDSGLLGVAVDPNFTTNGYIYIWHATGEESSGWGGETANRLSRFTMNSETMIADPASELILLDGLPHASMHNGGGLRFDNAGNLYVAIGDIDQSFMAMDLSAPHGKIFRIKPTEDGYTIPGDNPFRDDEDALPQIFAYGLRNPFRTTYRQSDGHIYIADVGAEHWEEINLGEPGVDYGWPRREGPCPIGEIEPCDAAPPRFTDPALYYAHPDEQGGSVTGLAFYAGNEFPEEYADQLFFADLNLQTIDVGALNEDGFAIAPFAANIQYLVDLEYHDEKLYYLQINNGKVGIITYTGIPNQLPVAAVQTDVTLGPSPLEVRFDASASYDPDGVITAYRWAFDDGSNPQATANPTVSHTYAEDGAYVAMFSVVDDDGAASETIEMEIQAYSGEIPAIVFSNLTDPGRQLFHGGDSWEYKAVRDGDNDDLDPDRPFVWSVAMHHNQHSHPVLSEQITDRAIFEISTDNHDGAWNIWYRFDLYMNTENGQQVHVSDTLHPALVTLGLDASPAPVTFTVNGVRREAPYEYRAIVGAEHVFKAPAEIVTDAGVGEFDYWHVHAGGWPPASFDRAKPNELTNPRLVLPVPEVSSTYMAYYRYEREANKVYLPTIMGTP